MQHVNVITIPYFALQQLLGHYDRIKHTLTNVKNHKYVREREIIE
jgi:hypothetical protein